MKEMCKNILLLKCENMRKDKCKESGGKCTKVIKTANKNRRAKTKCRDVMREECHIIQRERCKTIPERLCNTRLSASTIQNACRKVTVRDCVNMPRRECKTVAEEECRQFPVEKCWSGERKGCKGEMGGGRGGQCRQQCQTGWECYQCLHSK